MTTIAIIGGTGPEGKGLAARFAVAGNDVIIGSRSAERGEEAAHEIGVLTRKKLSGAANAAAARAAEVIVVTVPYSGQADTLTSIATDVGNKIVVSTVVPLQFSRRRVAMMDIAAGSAAEEAQELLPDARVVGAFQNLAAAHLLDIAHPIDGDVIVCSDDAAALTAIIELAESIEGVRGVNAGPLHVSRYVEGITALIVNINRVNKIEAHVKVVGF